MWSDVFYYRLEKHPLHLASVNRRYRCLLRVYHFLTSKLLRTLPLEIRAGAIGGKVSQTGIHVSSYIYSYAVRSAYLIPLDGSENQADWSTQLCELGKVIPFNESEISACTIVLTILCVKGKYEFLSLHINFAFKWFF